MLKIPYINYKELDEFYTLSQICKLFGMTKSELKKKCEQYGIEPRRNEIGEWVLVKYDVRKLHNAIYHEYADKFNQTDDDPWA